MAGVRRTGVIIKSVVAGAAKVVAPATLVGTANLLTIDADLVIVRGLRLLAPTASSCQPVQAMLAVTGTGTVVTTTRIAPKGTDTYGDCGYATGVAVSGGGTLRLMKSTIVDFQSFGVWARDAGSRVRISGSTISFLHPTAGSVGPGPVPPSSGVFVQDGAGGRVVGTAVTSRASTGFGSLVLGQGIVTTVGANGFVIDDVTVADADEAIFLGGSSGATMRNSTVSGGSIGIFLATQKDTTVSNNEVHVSGNAIYLDPGSTGNTITGNDASGPSGGRLLRPDRRNRPDRPGHAAIRSAAPRAAAGRDVSILADQRPLVRDRPPSWSRPASSAAGIGARLTGRPSPRRIRPLTGRTTGAPAPRRPAGCPHRPPRGATHNGLPRRTRATAATLGPGHPCLPALPFRHRRP